MSLRGFTHTVLNKPLTPRQMHINSIYHPLGMVQTKAFAHLAIAQKAQTIQTPHGSFDSSAFFSKSPGDNRYHVQLKVMKADRSCTVPVNCMGTTKALSDSGADLILLTMQTAQQLGYNLNMISDTLPVQGINGTPSNFKMVDVWTQLGNMPPMFVPLAFASTPNGLEENLLGSKGILDSGKVVAQYDSEGVTYMVRNRKIGGLV